MHVPVDEFPIASCPIAETMGLLGKKWSMTIMRDLLVHGHTRFGEMQRSNRGITPRVLSRRLFELQEAGFVEKFGDVPEYRATEKGQAMFPILHAVVDFGSVYEAKRVYKDGQPRSGAYFKQLVGMKDAPTTVPPTAQTTS